MKVNKIIIGGYVIGSLTILYPIRAADKEDGKEVKQSKESYSHNFSSERTRDLSTDENNNNIREPNKNTETRKKQR